MVNNIGCPHTKDGGYKEILGLDVTILDSSSTRPILSHLVQYFLVSSSRISNITLLYDGALTLKMSKMALNAFRDKTLH